MYLLSFPPLLPPPLLPRSEFELEEVLLACSAVKNTTSLLMNPLKENIQHTTKDSQAMATVGRLRDKQQSGHLKHT